MMIMKKKRKLFNAIHEKKQKERECQNIGIDREPDVDNENRSRNRSRNRNRQKKFLAYFVQVAEKLFLKFNEINHKIVD